MYYSKGALPNLTGTSHHRTYFNPSESYEMQPPFTTGEVPLLHYWQNFSWGATV